MRQSAASKLRADAAAAAFPLLQDLRHRTAIGDDFGRVTDALLLARIQGWKDAERAATRSGPLPALQAELRRMIRAARS